MSWKTITKDGQKMYESCDGEILGSTQDITALENYRKEQLEIRRNRIIENNSRREEDYPEIESMTKEQQIFICLIFIGFGIYGIMQFLCQ